MPKGGRPRLTEADLQARVRDYCGRYGVKPGSKGLPPFPAGQRETPQHREWIGLYKLNDRLWRRKKGQCERCDEPVVDGTIFCETHRTAAKDASVDDRKRLLEAQKGRCPICDEKVELWESAVDHGASNEPRGLLHASCGRLVHAAEAAGPAALDRLQGYLSGKPRTG